ncbi:MAG: GNAT family N-acetyltransferase [Pleurocapsa sp.]
MAEIEVKQLSIRDKNEVVTILFNAFRSSPIMNYFFGDKYQKSGKYLMQYICDLAEISDSFLLGAFLNGELKGVASITPSESERNSQTEAIDSLNEQLAIAVGEDVILRIEKYSQVKKINVPKQSHFYLDILGVMPEYQGQGIGKAIIKKLHKISQESYQSYGVALETGTENNVSIYQHLGYLITATTNIDNTKFWFMFQPNNA